MNDRKKILQFLHIIKVYTGMVSFIFLIRALTNDEPAHALAQWRICV